MSDAVSAEALAVETLAISIGQECIRSHCPVRRPEQSSRIVWVHKIWSCFCLEEWSERPNLVLRVVGDAHWPFPDAATVAPRAVAAIDLIESGATLSV